MVLICFPYENKRTGRDYRVKFPDEIVHECLAAGSHMYLINRILLNKLLSLIFLLYYHFK